MFSLFVSQGSSTFSR